MAKQTIAAKKRPCVLIIRDGWGYNPNPAESISIAHGGRIIRNLDAKRLEAVLHALYQPALERAWPQWAARARRVIGGEER